MPGVVNGQNYKRAIIVDGTPRPSSRQVMWGASEGREGKRNEKRNRKAYCTENTCRNKLKVRYCNMITEIGWPITKAGAPRPEIA